MHLQNEATPRKKARLIAFYLPQFHPVPENDEWHGIGFTEWTNVAKAKPLFRGHYQPHLPADLGFYDLRVPEVREAQANLAKEYGVEAFCYWHYWFGKGRRILERPFNEVLKSGKPDFPFCLAWANASWTGIWYGMSDNVLLKQTYPGKEDYEAHFYSILEALRDKRYLTVNGRKLIFIYDPHGLPDAKAFTEQWRELAKKEGLEGLHFVGATHLEEEPVYDGFDGSTQLAPFECIPRRLSVIQKALNLLIKRESITLRRAHHYSELVNYLNNRPLWKKEYPLVMPNWDNTPRSGVRGSVLYDSTPELFKKMLQNAIKKIDHLENPDERIIFVEAWNEWAEGNYLEPDSKFGHEYLLAVKEALFEV
jgi:lipopolysaccharide biosynthesis protein